MALKIFNTLTRKKDDFVPRDQGLVTVFVCGPTVYNYIHIGNARTFTSFDVIVKYLRYAGFKVRYIQNLTDVDDKIIKRAAEEGRSSEAVAKEYSLKYLDDMKSLGITAVDEYLPAMKYMPQIIDQVKRLIEKGHAYEISDGIYFDISTFPEYGKLSRQNIEELNSHRIDVNTEKRNPGDFVVWKKHKSGEPYWESPWGKGRPGWHIEDTAITEHEFGPQYDLHGGGNDLIFPHHECEIAQIEAVSGKVPLVNYWMHAGMLRVDETKMSKSLGNFHIAHEVISKYGGEVLRYFFVSNQYRVPLNFTFEVLDAAKNSLDRLHNFMRALKEVTNEESYYEVDPIFAKTKEDFEAAMNDDFETSKAFAAIFALVKEINSNIDKISKKDAQRIHDEMMKYDAVFGVIATKDEAIPQEILDMVAEREKARAAKDWATSDKLRDEIKAKGYVVDDKAGGSRVHKA